MRRENALMKIPTAHHHDVNNSKQPDRAALSDCQVLIWPLSLGKNQRETGFVLGWQTNDDNHQNATDSCFSFPATAIVAGILPTTKDAEPFHSLYNNNYQRHLEKVKGALCWCCTCSKVGDCQQPPPATSCAGCVRRHLFESLRVIAWYSHDDNSSRHELPSRITTLSSSLDIIHYHDQYQIPWIKGWDANKQKQYQIVYYNDKQQICYHDPRHKGGNSVFTQDILPWLSNANIVVSLIKKGVPRKPPLEGLASSLATTTTTTTTTTTSTHMRPENPVRTTTGTYSYSIFWQILSRLYHRQDRLHWYALVVAMHASGKNRDTPPLCTKCRKYCKRLSRAESIQQNVEYWNELLRAIADLLAGIVLLIAFHAALPMDIVGPLRGYFRWQSSLVQDGASWLETFPIGFKLNEPLTVSVGREIRSVVGFHEFAVQQIIQLLESMWVRHCCLAILVIVAVTLGATGVLAILLDVLRLAHVHLEVFSLAFRGLFRSELYLLSALWRVFRGKKRNVLRNRTDSMQYDSIQLLLGSILFAVTLFLFTTILVYHVFFAVCHLAFAITLNVLGGAIVWLRAWPAGVMVTRSIYHQWYANDCDLVELPSNISTINITSIRPAIDTIFVSVFGSLQSHILKFMAMTISQIGLALFGDMNEV
eukprot:scaffold8332_cov172-Amphora_coffeaeformis.AAC.5